VKSASGSKAGSQALSQVLSEAAEGGSTGLIVVAVLLVIAGILTALYCMFKDKIYQPEPVVVAQPEGGAEQLAALEKERVRIAEERALALKTQQDLHSALPVPDETPEAKTARLALEKKADDDVRRLDEEKVVNEQQIATLLASLGAKEAEQAMEGAADEFTTKKEFTTPTGTILLTQSSPWVGKGKSPKDQRVNALLGEVLSSEKGKKDEEDFAVSVLQHVQTSAKSAAELYMAMISPEAMKAAIKGVKLAQCDLDALIGTMSLDAVVKRTEATKPEILSAKVDMPEVTVAMVQNLITLKTVANSFVQREAAIAKLIVNLGTIFSHTKVAYKLSAGQKEIIRLWEAVSYVHKAVFRTRSEHGYRMLPGVGRFWTYNIAKKNTPALKAGDAADAAPPAYVEQQLIQKVVDEISHMAEKSLPEEKLKQQNVIGRENFTKYTLADTKDMAKIQKDMEKYAAAVMYDLVQSSIYLLGELVLQKEIAFVAAFRKAASEKIDATPAPETAPSTP